MFEVARRELADAGRAAGLHVVEELAGRVGRLALADALAERLERVGELLAGRDRRDLGEARRNDAGDKVDDGRAELADGELGKLEVEVGDVDEAGLEERDGDGDVEFALVLGVHEPVGDLLGDARRDGAEAVEEEDVGVAGESTLTAVQQLDDLLRAGEDGVVARGGRRGDEGDLLDDAAEVALLADTGELRDRLGGERLFELGEERGKLLHRLRGREDAGVGDDSSGGCSGGGGLRDVGGGHGGRLGVERAVASVGCGRESAETREILIDLQLLRREAAELEAQRVGEHARVNASRERSRWLRRARYAGASPSSTSSTAFSIATFSTTLQARSRFSATMTWIACSGSESSVKPFCRRRVRAWAIMLRRRGSLQVTSASDPARFCTMRCAAVAMLFSSPSIAKSFIVSSRVEMPAMVTERSTTGAMISRTARSMARQIRRLRAGFDVNMGSCELNTTRLGRFWRAAETVSAAAKRQRVLSGQWGNVATHPAATASSQAG
ncbi:hypothetical protein OF846_005352 [Rhodotorula toruloides]|nr:hypothetical protein OF846_005352 [Rhodotorula toruloides]